MAKKFLIMENTLKSIADGFRSSRNLDEQLSPARMAELAAEPAGFPNGTEWTSISQYLYIARYGNGIWVGGGASDGLWYSTNGIDWTQSNITSGTPMEVYFADGLWIADAQGGCYSTDGMNWTPINIDNGGSTINKVYKANGLWVMVSTGIYYSTDGINWTAGTASDGAALGGTDSSGTLIAPKCYFVHHANGIWVASYGNKSHANSGLRYSHDGKVWTYCPETHDSIYAPTGRITYAGEYWFADAPANTRLYRSTDGINWTMVSTPASFNQIIYVDGLFVVASNKGFYYSADGVNWTKGVLDISTSPHMTGVHYANCVYVSYGLNGVLCYSLDGKNWTRYVFSGSSSVHDVVNAHGLWIASATPSSSSTTAGSYYSYTWQPS